MLHYVVAVLVLQQLVGVLVQLLEDDGRLLHAAVLQDALDDAAAVGVRRQTEHLRGTNKHLINTIQGNDYESNLHTCVDRLNTWGRTKKKIIYYGKIYSIIAQM